MIYPVTMYAAKCDGCGKDVRLMGEYAAMVDELSVQEDLMNSGYHTKYISERKNEHYCPDCWTYDDNDNVIFKQQNK